MSDIRELLDNLDMESYLDSEGIDYKLTRGRSGMQLNVRECPVCGSKSFKVYLNAETGQGNCFAGDHPPGENFNKYKFIKAYIGATRVREVCQHIERHVRDQGWRPRRKSVAVEELGPLELPDSIELPRYGRNLAYLTKRGIDKETTGYFHLRYSHNGKFWFDWQGERRCQDYARRVIIPIYDLEGKLVSFQGRDITGEQEPKYLFPPSYASSGRYLYNGQNAHGAKRVVIGEGAFDAIALKQAMDGDISLRDVVPLATFGKHLSCGAEGDDQLAVFLTLKQEGLQEVTFMWDGEARALLDAIDAGAKLRAAGISVRIGVLPANKDPNEVSPDEVRRVFWQATPLTHQNEIKLRLQASRMTPDYPAESAL